MSSGRSGISFKVSKGDFEMRANELRIGNLVYAKTISYHKDAICSITGLTHKGIYVKYGRGHIIPINIEPILLTEEWLLKFGFTLGYSKWGYNIPKWMFDLTAFIGIGLNGDKKFFNVYSVNGDTKQILCSIKYVHQLQNLYFQLTGEEILR